MLLVSFLLLFALANFTWTITCLEANVRKGRSRSTCTTSPIRCLQQCPRVWVIF